MKPTKAEWCEMPGCRQPYAFVGEDRAGARLAVCAGHRRAVRWAWLKTRDGRFPLAPNARELRFKGA